MPKYVTRSICPVLTCPPARLPDTMSLDDKEHCMTDSDNVIVIVILAAKSEQLLVRLPT